jgi:hypothetical protein
MEFVHAAAWCHWCHRDRNTVFTTTKVEGSQVSLNKTFATSKCLCCGYECLCNPAALLVKTKVPVHAVGLQVEQRLSNVTESAFDCQSDVYTIWLNLNAFTSVCQHETAQSNQNRPDGETMALTVACNLCVSVVQRRSQLCTFH